MHSFNERLYEIEMGRLREDWKGRYADARETRLEPQ
jgi:hypothetical protein